MVEHIVLVIYDWSSHNGAGGSGIFSFFLY